MQMGKASLPSHLGKQTEREPSANIYSMLISQPYSHSEHQASKITVVTMVTIIHLK